MNQHSNQQHRVQRGEVTSHFLSQFDHHSNELLISMLADHQAQARTAAAKILGKHRCEPAVAPLCEALIQENALYTRLAICEALAAIGEPAINPLLELLGQIGNNQHRILPEKAFYKKSYPLPRDIAARILVRMHEVVLVKIEPILLNENRLQVLEAVDVIGHLSNRYQNNQCLNTLLVLYENSKDDTLLQWKILRAFQSFADQLVTDQLLQVIKSSAAAPLRWEAVRSLALQQRNFDKDILQFLRNDTDDEIRHLLSLFFADQYGKLNSGTCMIMSH
jgi:hypothetical protein